MRPRRVLGFSPSSAAAPLGPFENPPGGPQHLFDVQSLGILHRLRWFFSRTRFRFVRNQRHVQYSSAMQHHCARQNVIQFANIARPVPGCQLVHRGGGYALHARTGDECVPARVPGRRDGEIGIRFTRLQPETLLLSCWDDGVGMPEDLDWQNPSSLGLQMVRILTKQIGGKLSLVRDGVRAAIEVRFPGAARSESATREQTELSANIP
jgi:hypothetical protein